MSDCQMGLLGVAGKDQGEAQPPQAGHWILTRSTLQMLTTNLDRNLMKLSAAKTYLSAYGASVGGSTKKAFLKNLADAVKASNPSDSARVNQEDAK